MDINYLLAREQVSLIKAAAANNNCARLAHEGLARAYRAALSPIPLFRGRATRNAQMTAPNENPDRGHAG